MKLSWPAAVLLVLVPGWVLSQSLGEIAEQERAKRKKTGAKSYTNDDLSHPTPTPSPTATPAPAAEATPRPRSRYRFKVTPTPPGGAKPASEASAPPESSESEKGSGTAPAAPAKDEAYWRGQREAREKAIEAAEGQIKAVEQRIGELATDRNPNAGDIMDPDRLKKRDAELRQKADELERAKDALAAARQQLADLDEEARRAGVPPGWVR